MCGRERELSFHCLGVVLEANFTRDDSDASFKALCALLLLEKVVDDLLLLIVASDDVSRACQWNRYPRVKAKWDC